MTPVRERSPYNRRTPAALPTADLDTTLKQRLIGAAVLVALAVIFLPMLVKGPAPDSGVADVPLNAPPAPNDAGFQTRELPLVTPGDAPAGGALGMNQAPLAEPATAAPETAAPTPAAPPEQALPAAVAAGNYAVNFGAYASQSDANAVIARLRQSHLPGFSERTQIGGRPAWRVRIGPYASEAQAEAVRLQAVKVRNDVNAQVVTLDARPSPAAKPVTAAQAVAPTAAVHSEPLPPTAATPAKPVATTPTKPTKPNESVKPAPAKPVVAQPAVAAKPVVPAAGNVGFAVQLGAFARAEEANALRDKARAAGFSAFVEQVRTDNGALNRVRVGPVASRSEAEQLRAQLAVKVGISGMVRPHP